MSPSDGLESDDELSLPAGSQQLKSPGNENSRPPSHDGPAPVPFNIPPIPSRTRGPQSYLQDDDPPSPYVESSPTVSIPPPSPAIRSSRAPPIPMSSPKTSSAPQIRAPPPPPPTGLPSPKISTGDSKRISQVLRSPRIQDSEEEITAYEGDYDTDIPPSATRKEALRSHVRAPSLEDSTRADEAISHHSALPSLGLPISSVPRAAPPPPPSYPPKNARQSSDMPRVPPPPPPSKEQAPEIANTSFEPYSQTVPRTDRSAKSRNNSFEDPSTGIEHEPENIYATSSPRRELPPTPQQTAPPYNQPSSIPPLSRPVPKQSLEVQRPNFGGRRSMDTPRLSSEQGFIAGDIDLGQDSKWWTELNSVPPVLRNRQDLIYELEETSTTRRGGKQAMAKTLYILYMDYSQTVISAHFETRDPGAVTLEQRHEPPPSRLRQDQLEDAHTKFGSVLGDEATSKKDSVVGDGTPPALVSELISSLSDALPPVGIRAYGALVYTNLANASIQQFDEIRPGDVITFRSAKFQGHHGGLVKSKYATEIGKPDHVGIVVDWDGTKQKVRAWEQGREGRRVRMESFKLGDLRSGEVKVWRVMARNWVGWEGQG
jgi:myosin tail region-interacting protein MTI1